MAQVIEVHQQLPQTDSRYSPLKQLTLTLPQSVLSVGNFFSAKNTGTHSKKARFALALRYTQLLLQKTNRIKANVLLLVSHLDNIHLLQQKWFFALLAWSALAWKTLCTRRFRRICLALRSSSFGQPFPADNHRFLPEERNQTID